MARKIGKLAFGGRDFRALVTQAFHGQRNPAFLNIHLEHANVNEIAHVDHLIRRFNVGVGKLRNVNKTVAHRVDIDKNAERRNIGNPSAHNRALLQLGKLKLAFGLGKRACAEPLAYFELADKLLFDKELFCKILLRK